MENLDGIGVECAAGYLRRWAAALPDKRIMFE
jgi:hypothetical protein